jgi:hypothetical protein
MLSTRTRSIIIAGLASLSLAATTVAPAVSQARPILPTTKTSPACASLWGGFQEKVAKAEKLEKEGRTKQAEAAWSAAGRALDIFTDSGCVSLTVVKAAPSKVAASSSATQ